MQLTFATCVMLLLDSVGPTFIFTFVGHSRLHEGRVLLPAMLLSCGHLSQPDSPGPTRTDAQIGSPVLWPLQLLRLGSSEIPGI